MPSVGHNDFTSAELPHFHSDQSKCRVDPTQFRWSPFEIPEEDCDFTQVSLNLWLWFNVGKGLKTVAVSGDACAGGGLAIYVYLCNTNMTDK